MSQFDSEEENQYIQRFDTEAIRDFDFPVESGNQPMPYQQVWPVIPPEESAAIPAQAAEPIIAEAAAPLTAPANGPEIQEPQAAEQPAEQRPILPAKPEVYSIPEQQAQKPELHLDPRQIPMFINQLSKPPVYCPVSSVDDTYLYEIDISEFKQQILPKGFPQTTVWGYGGRVMDEGTNQFRYSRSLPGPTVEAVRNMPVKIRWVNKLSAPVVTHLHGGMLLPALNGPPDAWYTSDGKTGPAYLTPCYSYPNNQEAAALWYHDNAPGNGRRNVYAGLAGCYILRSGKEFTWQREGTLPRGRYEIPLVIQDRKFNTDGSLSFTGFGDGPKPGSDAGFLGDTITVNGKAWPNLNVERRQYRFRLLNGSDMRHYNLRLSGGMKLIKIGTDGGFLPEPVALDAVLLAPGQRADILVDFSRTVPGSAVIMTNDAGAPYPDGAAPDPQTTGQIMQFTVPRDAPEPVEPKKLPKTFGV